VDRDIATRSFDYIALSLAAYESSPEVNAFSSKFDEYLGGKVQLTPEEQVGFTLFKGKAGCTACHTATGTEPLFTDYTSSNLGVPKNTAIPYYEENILDKYGYTANPAGKAYIDNGVGHFLTSKDNPNIDWKQYESQFVGKFQVATMRNVDKRPSPEFVKAYMHNGYFKSLKEVVHFYNTRDTLPRCGPKDPGEKVTCWPAPEVSQNLDKTLLGNLHLTEKEENEIVAFLKTLTDGYAAKPSK
jgi:cytochrome c peroxidase